MATEEQAQLAREMITEGRYLVLATTDGGEPWVAPIEYMRDEDLNLYFLSPRDSLHARHIEANPVVAVAIFDRKQPAEYSADASVTLRGVQIRGRAERLERDQYPEIVSEAIEALQPPMPPYEAYRIEPVQVFVPRLVDGVNERVEVEIG